MAPERAEAGARRVEQHRVHRPDGFGERLGRVVREHLDAVIEPEPARLGADLLQLRRIEVDGEHRVRLGLVTRLASRCRAGVQHPRSLGNGGVEAHQLRGLVLHLEAALGEPHQLLHRPGRGQT
jgi:hypothetical protein